MGATHRKVRGDVHQVRRLEHKRLDSCQRRDGGEGGRQAVEVDARLQAPGEELLPAEAAAADELVAGGGEGEVRQASGAETAWKGSNQAGGEVKCYECKWAVEVDARLQVD